MSGELVEIEVAGTNARDMRTAAMMLAAPFFELSEHMRRPDVVGNVLEVSLGRIYPKVYSEDGAVLLWQTEAVVSKKAR